MSCHTGNIKACRVERMREVEHEASLLRRRADQPGECCRRNDRQDHCDAADCGGTSQPCLKSDTGSADGFELAKFRSKPGADAMRFSSRSSRWFRRSAYSLRRPWLQRSVDQRTLSSAKDNSAILASGFTVPTRDFRSQGTGRINPFARQSYTS